MIKNFIKDITNIDSKIVYVMSYGFKISLLILLFACYILALYSTYPFSHVAYLSGLNLFRLSLTCFSAIITRGMAINKISQ